MNTDYSLIKNNVTFYLKIVNIEYLLVTLDFPLFYRVLFNCFCHKQILKPFICEIGTIFIISSQIFNKESFHFSRSCYEICAAFIFMK